MTPVVATGVYNDELPIVRACAVCSLTDVDPDRRERHGYWFVAKWGMRALSAESASRPPAIRKPLRYSGGRGALPRQRRQSRT
jgi:hypothetical protein